MEEAAYIGDNIFILKDSLPTNIKKEVNVDLSQKERLSRLSKNKRNQKNINR